MNASSVNLVDLARDVELALLLTGSQPTGPTTDALRQRLRGYITALAGPAESYGRRLPDTRERDIVLDTVRHARAVAADQGHSPVASLRLLAKSAEFLSRYATAGGGPG